MNGVTPRWTWGILVVVLVGVLAAHAWAVPAPQDLPPDHPPVNVTPGGVPERPSAAAGAPIYQQSCAPCHGDTGQGDGPAASGLPAKPTAFADPATLRRLSPRQIFEVIRNGRIERGMPPWANRLSEDATWAVVAYLLDLNLPPDEYEAGRAIYQASCAACHGPTGQGDGPQAEALDVPDLTRWPDWVDVSNVDWQGRLQEDPVHQQAVQSLSPEELAQAVAYVRTLSYSSTRAPLVGNGEIRGQVTMMTPGAEADFSGLEVTLFGFRGSMTPQLVVTTTVAPDRTFVFRGLSTEPDVLYSVAATWEGAQYSSGVIGFPPGQDVITTTLTVAATTEEDPGIRAEQVHWFVDFEQGQVVVGELVSLTNPGDRAYIGEPLPDVEGKRSVVRWPLPPGAQDVAVEGGELGDRFLLVDNALIDTLPLTPGVDTRRLLFRYTLPITNGTIRLAHPTAIPIRFLNVFIADRGQTVQVPDFMVEGQRRNIGDVSFRSYMASNIPAGTEVTIVLTNVPANPAVRPSRVAPLPVSRVAGGVLAGLFGVGLLAGLFYLSRRQAASRRRMQLQARRDALLEQVAALDVAFEEGRIDEATYREERDLRMAEAVRLTMLLEEERPRR